MADGPRRRNVAPPNQTPATATTPEASGRTKIRKTEPVEEGEEPIPELFKFSTWPPHVKRFPLYALLVLLGVLYYNYTQAREEASFKPGLDLSTFDRCVKTYPFPFPVNRLVYRSDQGAAVDWEFGTTAEAQLELLYPGLGVFGEDPFPNGQIPKSSGWSMNEVVQRAHKRVWIFGPTLSTNNSFSVSEPTTLGIWAIMANSHRGKKDYMTAATQQKNYLLDEAPKYSNGAISHRVDVPELSAEAIGMFPPFLAYYGVATADLSILRQSVHQIQLYHGELQIQSGKLKGLWRHSVGPSDLADPGAWSLGNGWAAYGMARVRATISKWRESKNVCAQDFAQLDDYIAEILDAVIRTDTGDQTRLLRNYLGDHSWLGETSGTALLAATAFRMAVMNPSRFAEPKYLDWARAKWHAVSQSVDADGYAQPAANAQYSLQREPVEPGSHHGASFVLMLSSAYRDCVCVGLCKPDEGTKMRDAS